MSHTFYSEELIVDLVYMVAAHKVDDEDDPTEPHYGIMVLMEVGSTPQHEMGWWDRKSQRDEAWTHLRAMHEQLMLAAHPFPEED